MSSTKNKDFLFLIFLFFIIFLMAEIVLRCFKPQPTYSRLKDQVGNYYVASDFNTFTLKPGYIGKDKSQDFPNKTINININSEGFRGDELNHHMNDVLIIGDSYTFGLYLDNEETYPRRLEKLIQNKHPKYQVINAGYTSGHETDQQYSWLVNYLKAHKPKIIILGVFLGNDILGIKQEAWKEVNSKNLPTKWLDTDLEVTSEGFIKNKVLDPIKTVATERIYKYPFFRDSHLIILITKSIDRWRKIYHKKKNSLKNFNHENTLEQRFSFIYGYYTQDFLSKEKVFLDLIHGMQIEAKKINAKFYTVLIPINFMVAPNLLKKVIPENSFVYEKPVYYDRLESYLSKHQINNINVFSAMLKERNKELFFPENGEVHFNALGADFASKEIFRSIERDLE